MTSASQTGSASRHEKDHTVTQILSDSRSVRVVLYHSTPAESEHQFWIDPEMTHGGVAQALAEVYPSQEPVVLEANWGPRPYWTESHPESPIGSTCRVLYAILKDQAKPYTIGVVRTSLSDYPIPIYVPEPKSSMTILEAVIASCPKLTDHVKSIVHHSGDDDVQDDAWGDEVAEDQTYPEAPLFINTLDEPSKEFLSGSLYEAFSPSSPKASAASDSDEIIPPILQISFAECKLLVQRAYDLDEFPLQMIHLSEAIFHVVISLARSLNPVFENGSSNIGDALSAEDDLADHLRIAPLFCRQLEEHLGNVNGIMDHLEDGTFDREETERAIHTIFGTLCGDLPGAVTVRCSAEVFQKCTSIECKGFDTLAFETLDVESMDHNGDVVYPLGRSSQPDWRVPSGEGRVSNALWIQDNMEANKRATSGDRSPTFTLNSAKSSLSESPSVIPYPSPDASPSGYPSVSPYPSVIPYPSPIPSPHIDHEGVPRQHLHGPGNAIFSRRADTLRGRHSRGRGRNVGEAFTLGGSRGGSSYPHPGQVGLRGLPYSPHSPSPHSLSPHSIPPPIPSPGMVAPNVVGAYAGSTHSSPGLGLEQMGGMMGTGDLQFMMDPGQNGMQVGNMGSPDQGTQHAQATYATDGLLTGMTNEFGMTQTIGSSGFPGSAAVDSAWQTEQLPTSNMGLDTWPHNLNALSFQLPEARVQEAFGNATWPSGGNGPYSLNPANSVQANAGDLSELAALREDPTSAFWDPTPGQLPNPDPSNGFGALGVVDTSQWSRNMDAGQHASMETQTFQQPVYQQPPIYHQQLPETLPYTHQLLDPSTVPPSPAKGVLLPWDGQPTSQLPPKSNLSPLRRLVMRHSNSKQKLHGQRSEADYLKLAQAFLPGSFRADPVLRYFLDIIRTRTFYLEDRHEPLLGTPEAEQIFAQVRAKYPHDIRFTSRNDPKFASQTIDKEAEAQSIFMTMTENNRCLICGQQKDRTERALGHVRSDIGHRPYHCTCEKCIQSANPRRFFSDNLLDDHLKGQQVKQECVYCHSMFRRGGMKRHIASKHPEHVQGTHETQGNDANADE